MRARAVRSRLVRFLILGAAASVLAPTPAPAADRILIDAKSLQPPVVATVVGHRVTFVNRSGRPAHIEFLGDSTGHRVFQVPGEIWAVFHYGGRHEYVVHFSTRGKPDLRGAVEVRDDPAEANDLPVCDGITVMEVCLER